MKGELCYRLLKIKDIIENDYDATLVSKKALEIKLNFPFISDDFLNGDKSQVFYFEYKVDPETGIKIPYRPIGVSYQ